jgi:hypothetical protein
VSVEDRPRLSHAHDLYSVNCPEPEDVIENSEDRELRCEYLEGAGSVRYLAFRGASSSEYLASSIWCRDLSEYR